MSIIFGSNAPLNDITLLTFSGNDKATALTKQDGTIIAFVSNATTSGVVKFLKNWIMKDENYSLYSSLEYNEGGDVYYAHGEYIISGDNGIEVITSTNIKIIELWDWICI